MTEFRIAGHMWTNDRLDSCCELIKDDGETCYMTRATLFSLTREDVSKPGLAHISALSSTEYTQIEEARKAHNLRCEKLMEALRQVCG